MKFIVSYSLLFLLFVPVMTQSYAQYVCQPQESNPTSCPGDQERAMPIDLSKVFIVKKPIDTEVCKKFLDKHATPGPEKPTLNNFRWTYSQYYPFDNLDEAESFCSCRQTFSEKGNCLKQDKLIEYEQQLGKYFIWATFQDALEELQEYLVMNEPPDKSCSSLNSVLENHNGCSDEAKNKIYGHIDEYFKIQEIPHHLVDDDSRFKSTYDRYLEKQVKERKKEVSKRKHSFIELSQHVYDWWQHFMKKEKIDEVSSLSEFYSVMTKKPDAKLFGDGGDLKKLLDQKNYDDFDINQKLILAFLMSSPAISYSRLNGAQSFEHLTKNGDKFFKEFLQSMKDGISTEEFFNFTISKYTSGNCERISNYMTNMCKVISGDIIAELKKLETKHPKQFKYYTVNILDGLTDHTDPKGRVSYDRFKFYYSKVACLENSENNSIVDNSNCDYCNSSGSIRASEVTNEEVSILDQLNAIFDNPAPKEEKVAGDKKPTGPVRPDEKIADGGDQAEKRRRGFPYRFDRDVRVPVGGTRTETLRNIRAQLSAVRASMGRVQAQVSETKSAPLAQSLSASQKSSAASTIKQIEKLSSDIKTRSTQLDDYIVSQEKAGRPVDRKYVADELNSIQGMENELAGLDQILKRYQTGPFDAQKVVANKEKTRSQSLASSTQSSVSNPVSSSASSSFTDSGSTLVSSANSTGDAGGFSVAQRPQLFQLIGEGELEGKSSELQSKTKIGQGFGVLTDNGEIKIFYFDERRELQEDGPMPIAAAVRHFYIPTDNLLSTKDKITPKKLKQIRKIASEAVEDLSDPGLLDRLHNILNSSQKID